jgi:hypothetical protein
VYSFDIEKIHETAWVFKNAIKNSQDFVDYFEGSQEWKDWYTFGKVSVGPNIDSARFESFPTFEEWNSSKNYKDTAFGEKNYFENQVNDLFYYATKLYAESNNIVFPNWISDSWNIAKYVPNAEHDDYVMMHHTDFQREFKYSPGSKFGITAVFYLNDNYTGGEVSFRFLDEKDPSIVKDEYTYKPAAGDIVVFPSGPPHYHGVKAVSSGEKYIIRNYWHYDSPAHPLYLKLQQKYGEDIWRQMEEQRLKFNRDPKNMKTINNVIFYMDFEEYYKKEIEMLGI